MNSKIGAVIGAGALGILAIIVMLFMFIPRYLTKDALNTDIGETIGGRETVAVTPYKNTLDMHIGKVIVSCDIKKKDRNICLNSITDRASDNTSIYVWGLYDEGVRYTLYTSTNRTQTEGYAEPGEDTDDWKDMIGNRVEDEEKKDRISLE